MKKIPVFSIIIPTFNSEKTLQKCLDSIVNQSFSNYEVLIIDGGSIDNSLKIIEKYNDKRFKITSESDNGIYDAMNKGITFSLGEWIYFLGSDDELYNENVLEKVYSRIINTNFHVVYGNVVSVRFNGIYAGEFDYGKLYNQNICHQAIFFNKRLFNKIGNFNLKYKSHADYDHNIRWFLNKRINQLYMNEVIANYADGGFSSQGIDQLFLIDKDYRFVSSGFTSLPKWFLLQLCEKGNVDPRKQLRLTKLSRKLKFRKKIVKIINFVIGR